MTLDTLVEGKKLIINESYLRRGKNTEELYKILDEDLTRVSDGGEVHLIRPNNSGLNPLFADVLSYICGKAIKGNYIIKPDNDYDASKIKVILGGNVSGDLQQGYRFQKKE